MRVRMYVMSFTLLTISAIVVSACAGPATTAAPPEATQSQATEPQATDAPATTPSQVTPAPESQVTLEEVDPSQYDGNVIAAGSSTVFPLAERMAEIFKEDGFAGNITVDSIGSGAGLERFCVTGETDIATASRAIRDTEVESCQAIGREPVEFRVGTDALAVVVSSENDFLENVSLEELAKVFSSEAQTWSEVNPAWPAEDIQRFSPGTDSGTYDYFVESVMLPVYGEEAAEASLLDSANLQLSEDDNVLVQGVLGSPYAIGYFGYAYYQENAGDLKILSINGVTASGATVDNGEYPIARPLFIYSDATIMQEKPQVAAFVNYFLTYVDDEIREVGYFPASPVALDASRQAWLEAAQ